METHLERDTTSSPAEEGGEMSQLKVPEDYACHGLHRSVEFKVWTTRNALECKNALASQDQSQNQLFSSGLPTSSSELSPIYSVSPGPTPNALESKALSFIPDANSTSVNKFNWRKYGQKRVKSPQGSRSYYRCTYADCGAKKIECSDQSNRMVEIITKGQHNHDPPRRTNCARGSSVAFPATPYTTTHTLTLPNDKDYSTFSRETVPEIPVLAETKGNGSIDSDRMGEINVREEHIGPPEWQESPSKKAKVVIHGASDVKILEDGYRWRKYGQKMVKGNPHPRNYYRCTSGGCPVRKLVEVAVDNESVVIITYKGEHDHEMPVTKKKDSPPSGPPVAVAAPASKENLQKEPETIQNQVSTTQWSVDADGELTSGALGTADEKAMESAQTLLSIGFEIKQY